MHSWTYLSIVVHSCNNSFISDTMYSYAQLQQVQQHHNAHVGKLLLTLTENGRAHSYMEGALLMLRKGPHSSMAWAPLIHTVMIRSSKKKWLSSLFHTLLRSYLQYICLTGLTTCLVSSRRLSVLLSVRDTLLLLLLLTTWGPRSGWQRVWRGVMPCGDIMCHIRSTQGQHITSRHLFNTL